MPQSTNGIADKIQTAIENSPHIPRRTLRYEAKEGHVVLRGTVSTYFQKLMAQEAIRDIEGVGQIRNELEVSWA